VKPNQIGTVSDARETVELAEEESYTPVISHRSGETCDATISDLALEWECPVIKAGIADIRIAKLNKLMRLWDHREDAKINQR
jgi:enolase